MNIKNYTTTVPVSKSVEKIISKLVSVKATNISLDYDGGKLTGIVFSVNQNNQPIFFKLPANETAVQDYFIKERQSRASKTRLNQNQIQALKEQASRVAWKMLEEWVHLQISYMEVHKRDITELFLAQAYNPAKKQTFYEAIKENGFRQLTQGEE